MDTSGETHIDIVHNIYKRRLDLEGQPIEDPQREQGVGETKKIINGTKAAGSDQVHISVQFFFFIKIGIFRTLHIHLKHVNIHR